MLLHIPHSQKYIPDEYLQYFHLSDSDLDVELLKMTDHFTDQLFECSQSNCSEIIFPVSRLLVDPERFIMDADEPMSARGMGCIYEKTHDQNPLKDCCAIRQVLIDRYYETHHARFAALVDKELEKTESKLINHRVWGKKRLAYQIEKQKYGTYVLLQFEEGNQDKMVDFSTWMKLNNSIIRHMTVLLDSKPELYAEESKKDEWNYWYRRILIKDFKCGVSESTVNACVKKSKKSK